jgi:hypothetical protein
MLNLAFDRILVSIFRVFQSPIQHFRSAPYSYDLRSKAIESVKRGEKKIEDS